MYIIHIFLFAETAASAAFQRPSTENMKTPMNNEIAVTEWKREYCGTDDFKGTPVRIFKVEAGLNSTYDLQAAARGVENNNVKEELREAAVPLSKTSIVMGQQEAEVGIRGTATIKCEPSWGTVRSPKRENQPDDFKVHSETDLKKLKKEAGVVVWVKEEPTFAGVKKEVGASNPSFWANGEEVNPSLVSGVEAVQSGSNEQGPSEDLVWCGELVWQVCFGII